MLWLQCCYYKNAARTLYTMDMCIGDVSVKMAVCGAELIQWSLKLDLYEIFFSCRRKVVSEGTVQMGAGRLFQADEAVTGNA